MNMDIYSLVRLVSDSFADRGVEKGREGTIIEKYGDRMYEVDFSKDCDEIITLIVKESDIEYSINAQ